MKRQIVHYVGSILTLVACGAAAQDHRLVDGIQAYSTEKFDEAVRLLLPPAEAGDVRAQTYLGRAYVTKAVGGLNNARRGNSAALQIKSGRGAATACRNPADGREGERWLKRAARSGSSDAGLALVTLYRQGACGVEASPALAEDWSRRTALALEHRADGGDLEAQYQLGTSKHGHSFHDAETALRWLTRAAEGGHVEAQAELGWKYFLGEGTDRDHERGRAWLERAAEGGLERAQIYLAYRHVDGRHGFPKDTARALEWYRKCRAQHPRCEDDELDAVHMRDVLVGGPAIMASLQRGEAEVLFRKALALERDRQQPDHLVQAAGSYERAAELGHVQAHANLAAMYYEGRGVREDHARAVQLYRTAAEQGHREAQYQLARMYEQGDGVVRDLLEAGRWYRLSARNGKREAQARAANVEQVQGRPEVHAVFIYRPGRLMPETDYCPEVDEHEMLGGLGSLSSPELRGPHEIVSGIRMGPPVKAAPSPVRHEVVQEQTVELQVARTGRPLILALGSYSPATWRLRLEPGVVVQQVILIGRQQQVTGLSPEVRVTMTALPHVPTGSTQDVSYVTGFSQRDVRHAHLQYLTGLEPVSYRSLYQAQQLSVSDHIIYPWYTAHDAVELHAIAASSGVGKYQRGCTTRGKIVVDVLPTAKPLVLALSSSKPVAWQLRVANGAKIARVLVFGNYEAQVHGLSANVPVIDMQEALDSDTPSVKRGDPAAKRLTEITGLDVQALQRSDFAITEGLFRIPHGKDGVLMAGRSSADPHRLLRNMFRHPRNYLVEEHDTRHYDILDQSGRTLDPATVQRLCVFRAFSVAAAGKLDFVEYKRPEAWLALELLLTAGEITVRSAQDSQLRPVKPRGFLVSSRRGRGYEVALARPPGGCGTLAYLDKDPALGAVKPVTELGPVRWENERDLLQQQLATLVERQREFGESFNSNVTIYQEPDEDKNEDYRDFFERAEISGSCFAHSNRRYCYREYFQLHEGGGIGMRLLFLLGRNSEPARILTSEGIFGSGVPAAAQPWLIADIDRDGTEELILRSRPSENGGYFVHFSSMETSVRVVSSEDPADLIPGSVFAYQVIPASILTDP